MNSRGPGNGRAPWPNALSNGPIRHSIGRSERPSASSCWPQRAQLLSYRTGHATLRYGGASSRNPSLCCSPRGAPPRNGGACPQLPSSPYPTSSTVLRQVSGAKLRDVKIVHTITRLFQIRISGVLRGPLPGGYPLSCFCNHLHFKARFPLRWSAQCMGGCQPDRGPLILENQHRYPGQSQESRLR